MKILGFDVDIVYKDNGMESDRIGCFKYCPTPTIFLDKTLKKDGLNETKLHEVLEAIDSILELKIEHPAISALSAALFQVIKENGGNISKWE